MKISDSFNLKHDKLAKLTIICSVYSAMISIAQELRRTVERLTIWGCGLILLLDGWLVLGKIPVALKAKVVISIGIFMFFAITVFIVTTLQQRYDGVAQVIRRINEVQMAYETGVFLDNETLMPKYWKRYGSSQWKEPIFHISYISLTTVCLLGISVVWFI